MHCRHGAQAPDWLCVLAPIQTSARASAQVQSGAGATWSACPRLTLYCIQCLWCQA